VQSPTRTEGARLSGDRCNKREAGVLDLGAKQVAKAEWNFDEDGGAVGTIAFNVKIPQGCIVTNVWAYPRASVTSGGAMTYKLQCGSTDLNTATAYNAAGADLSGSAVVDVPLDGAVEGLQIGTTGELKLVIAGAAATAGRVYFAVEFYKYDFA
jgi:hypothetical protein